MERKTECTYQRYKLIRNHVFYYTFISYALLHLSRKCYSNMKVALEQNASFDPVFLSIMDTVFMLFYAIGSFFAGILGTIFSGPLIVSIGLFGTSFCMIAFAILIWCDVENSNSEFLRTFLPLFFWLLHGLFQSTGGPANTAIMSNWYGSRHRGYIFGIWTCHQYIGNITAALLASFILYHDQTIPWEIVFLIPAVISFVWGIFILYDLPEKPEHVQELAVSTTTTSTTAENTNTANINTFNNTADYLDKNTSAKAPYQILNPSISIYEAIQIPNVIGYSWAFGLFKFVNYALFFWLPFYLSRYFDPKVSNLISILYDVGMIPGGILVGYISDMCGGRRACVIAVFTFLLIPFLLFFAHHDAMEEAQGGVPEALPMSSLLVLLGIMGCLIGGPINIITSAVAVDLVEDSSIGGRNDLITVTGIINGCGSIMASLGLVVVGPLSIAYGWKYVWLLLTFCTLLGTLLMYPVILKEFRMHEETSTALPMMGNHVVNEQTSLLSSPTKQQQGYPYYIQEQGIKSPEHHRQGHETHTHHQHAQHGILRHGSPQPNHPHGRNHSTIPDYRSVDSSDEQDIAIFEEHKKRHQEQKKSSQLHS